MKDIIQKIQSAPTAKNNKIMSITIHDFSFEPSGYGHYRVTYTSPKTGKTWTTVTNNMPLIDATKNEDEPKIKDLNLLKRYCKS